MNDTKHELYEMTGIVHQVLEEKTFSSGFRKRDIVLTNDIGDDSKYPKYVPFTFKKDRADLLANMREGMRVKVVFAVDGREYNGRYFCDLVGIKIENLNDPRCVPEPATPEPTMGTEEVADDAMPF